MGKHKHKYSRSPAPRPTQDAPMTIPERQHDPTILPKTHQDTPKTLQDPPPDVYKKTPSCVQADSFDLITLKLASMSKYTFLEFLKTYAAKQPQVTPTVVSKSS